MMQMVIFGVDELFVIFVDSVKCKKQELDWMA